MNFYDSPEFWRGMVFLIGGLIVITCALWVADWYGNRSEK